MKHYYKHFTITAALIFLLLPQDAFSQQIYQLNSLTDQPSQAAAKTISGEDQTRTYFSVNEELIETQLLSNGDILELELTPGTFSEMKITRISEYVPGVYSYIAYSEDNPNISFAFTYSEGKLNGLYHKADHSTLYFEYDSGSGQNYIATISSQDDFQACGLHESLETPVGTTTTMNKLHDNSQGRDLHVPTFEAMQSLTEDLITIDLLIAYTPKAKNYADGSGFGSIESLIAQSMNISQQALDNSDIEMEIRLVHYYETNYDDDESETTGGDHLRRFTRGPANPIAFCNSNDQSCDESQWDGYMEEVHELRNQHGADLVALFASQPNTGGIAWLLNTIHGRQDIGFSVNRVQQVATNETLIHEIGHNMGLAHSRTQSENAAGITGGLFEFSTGQQFQANGSGHSTVMAYEEAGFSRIPYFSSPEVEFQGSFTGTETRNNGGPADNVRSLNLLKRTVANYRTTRLDPPVIGITPNEITVNLNREDQTEAVVNINNTGMSGLMWDIDFRFVEGVQKASAKKDATGNRTEHHELSFDGGIHHELNNPAFTSAITGVVYETDFSQDDGFTTGTRGAMESWTTWNATSGNFNISTENALTGGQHMRAQYQSGIQNNIIFSPYWGPQIFSKYELTMSFYLPDNEPTRNGRFDIYFYDFSMQGGSVSGGFILLNEQLYAMDLNEQGGSSFFPSAGIEFGQYHDLKVVYNTDNQTVDYYLDNIRIRESGYYPAGGFKPDQIWVWSDEDNVSGSYIDVDNLKVERTGTPTSWLSADRFGGVTSPEENSDLTLTFNTAGMEAGTYELTMLIRGNDPDAPVHEIPVTLEVNEAVSLEDNNETPVRTQLAQNYPNPFNPSTKISYTLAGSGQVNLSVYDMIGRKVATLVNEQVSAGEHHVRFDGSNLSSGVYIYRLQTPSETLTRQMVLIK